MDREAGHEKMILAGRHGIALFVAVQFVMSLAYLGIQYRYLGRVNDWPYVALIFVNALLVWWTLRVQYTLLSENERTLSRKPFVHRLFSDKRMLLSGILLGAAFSIGPFNAVLFSTFQVKLALSALLFVHMLVVGMGLYALVMYFLEMRKVAANIGLMLWNRHTGPMTVFSHSVRLLVVMMTFGIGIALGCLQFSHFRPGAYVNLFAISSFAILLAVYAFPFWFVNRRYHEVQAQHLRRLGDLIETEYASQLDRIQSGETVTLDRFKLLRELYSSTNEAPSAYRMDWGTARTVATMLVPTVLPYMNSTQLNRLFELIQQFTAAS